MKVMIKLNKDLFGYLDKRKALSEIMTFDLFVADFQEDIQSILP